MGISSSKDYEDENGYEAIINTAYDIYHQARKRKLRPKDLHIQSITMKSFGEDEALPPFWKITNFMKKDTKEEILHKKKEEIDTLWFPIHFDKDKNAVVQPLYYGDLIILQVEDKYDTKRDLVLENMIDKRMSSRKREVNDFIDGIKLFRILPAISSDSQNTQEKEIEDSAGNKKISKNNKTEKKIAEKARNEYEKSKVVYKELIGKAVKFENKVQLVHEATHQYLSAGKYETLEKRNGKKTIVYRASLSIYGSSNTHFQFLPKFPAQMERGQNILTNHSVKLVAEEPNNPLGVIFPVFYSKYDKEKNKSLFFVRKDNNIFFKFEVVRKFSNIGEENIIQKPIRLHHELKPACLQPDTTKIGTKKRNILFSKNMTSWNGLWQIIKLEKKEKIKKFHESEKEVKKEAKKEEKKEAKKEVKKEERKDFNEEIYLRHVLTNQYLSVTDILFSIIIIDVTELFNFCYNFYWICLYNL